jgi:hypothetical protein
VAFYDAEHKRRLVFLTNNFTLPALTIVSLQQACNFSARQQCGQPGVPRQGRIWLA